MSIITIDSIKKIARLSDAYDRYLNELFEFYKKLDIAETDEHPAIKNQIKAFSNKLRQIDEERHNVLISLHPYLMQEIQKYAR